MKGLARLPELFNQVRNAQREIAKARAEQAEMNKRAVLSAGGRS